MAREYISPIATAYSTATRDAQLDQAEFQRKETEKSMKASFEHKKEIDTFLRKRMRDADKIAKMVEDQKAKAREAKGKKKPEKQSIPVPTPHQTIGRTDNIRDISAADPGEIAGGGGAQAKAAMSGFSQDSGPLTTTTSGTHEVPVKNAWGTFPMELRNQQTVNRPRGMTNYQQAQVGIAQQRNIIAQQRDKALTIEGNRTRQIQGLVMGMDAEQSVEWASTPFSQMTKETQDKAIDFFRDQTKSQKSREAMAIEVESLTIQARLLELKERIATRKQSTRQEPRLDDMTLYELAGWGPGGIMTQEQSATNQNRIAGTLATIAKSDDFDEISPGLVWSGLTVLMSRYNRVPVLAGKESFGEENIDNVYDQISIATDPSFSEEQRKRAEGVLIDWGMIDELDMENNKLVPTASGPLSTSSQRIIESYYTRQKLEAEYGGTGILGTDPDSLMRRRQEELGRGEPGKRRVSEVNAQIDDMLLRAKGITAR